MPASRLAGLAFVLLLAAAYDPGAAARPSQPLVSETAPARTAAQAPIDDSAFAALVRDLSEPGGFFDTDNLISNEASYLHVVGELGDRGVRGGAYVGVGPAQNFSYLAAIRPALAFLIDIRRDNLLQHLWFKALFERSATRLDYLCLMVARSCGGASGAMTLEALIRTVEDARPVERPDSLIDAVVRDAAATGVELSPGDRERIRSIHLRFARAGLDLRFNSYGRAPRPSYPTLRQLLLERDRRGRRSNYLADAGAYRYLRSMQRENRLIPVVGDLAGSHAMRAIGEEVSRRGLVVSALYVSNVEFYLFGGGVFPRYMANLAALPVAESSVIIRSYFNRFRPIPQTVPGYASTQLLQSVPALLTAWQEGRASGYRALILGGG
jgi:hypothetical protein